MKKIAIVTLHKVRNYGSVLQAYATQKAFEDMGADAFVVDYYSNERKDENQLKIKLEENRKSKRNPIMKIIYKIFVTLSRKKMQRVFDSFINTELKLTTKCYHSNEELSCNLPDANIFCTGSDQVWNSHWNNGIEEPFFLNFVPDEKVKMSYAASIGKSELNEQEKTRTQELLKRYNYLSVREQTGVKIINELGIPNVERVVDPTMLLSREQWEQIATKRMLKKDYILTYQVHKNKQFDDYVERMAKEKNCKLVRISYYYNPNVKGTVYYVPTVYEFLSLFKHARYVVANSFHATAFSLKFNKQFAIIFPDNFKSSSRIIDVLKQTGLSDRIVKNYEDFQMPDQPIDYNRVNAVLETEINKSKDFIRNIINR